MAGRPLGELFDSAREDFGSIKDDTIALGKQEIATSAKHAGIGALAVVVALVVLLLSPLIFALALVYALASMGLWLWVAYVIVGVVLVALTAAIALYARSRFRRVKAPTRTMAALSGAWRVLLDLLPSAKRDQERQAAASDFADF